MGRVRNAIRVITLPPKKLILGAVDGLVGLVTPAPAENRVLVARLDAIGDYILWLTSARALRKLYPAEKYHITLLANSTWAALAEKEQCFDSVWPVDRWRLYNDPLYRFRLLLKARKGGFDTAIQPTYSREYYIGDSVVRASSARERIGSVGDTFNMTPSQKSVSDRWYTRLVPTDKRPMDELQRNAEFVRGLGINDFTAEAVTFPPGYFKFPSLAGLPADYYILLPGGGGYEGKRWPVNNYIEIARRIHERTGWTAVICGGGKEKKLGGAISAGAGVPVLDMVGKTALEELGGLIEKARMVIGSDTGAVHMAAALGTPSVAVLAGAQYGRFLPYDDTTAGVGSPPVALSHRMDCFGCDWRCVYNPEPGRSYPCVAAVTVDEAWEKVDEILRRNGH